MKTFCKTFGYRLYHPEDTSLICKHRALKLRFPQCCSCLGLELPVKEESEKESLITISPSMAQTQATEISPPNNDGRLLEWIKEKGMAHVGRMLGDKGVDRRTVQMWITREKIPNKTIRSYEVPDMLSIEFCRMLLAFVVTPQLGM